MEFRYKESALVDDEEVSMRGDELASYAEYLYDVASSGNFDDPAASLCALDDADSIEEARSLWREKQSEELKHVFLIGIGGSNLGFKAFYDARNLYADEYSVRAPRFHFLDTVDEKMLAEAVERINRLRSPREALFIAVSKSGETVETAYNLEAVWSALAEKFGTAAGDRLVFISDENSPMHASAKRNGIASLGIPPSVGGRYSVFTAAGIFPLFAAGFDVEEIVDRSKAMRDVCLTAAPSDNPAVASAAAIYSHLLAGRGIHNFFAFGSELESLGKWHRQLMAESLGKREDLDGRPVQTGITPIVSVGSIDLHSAGQLYFDGPDDKFTSFVSMRGVNRTELESGHFNLVSNIAGKSAQDIQDAILNGVEEAYYDSGLPFMEVRLESTADIGSFMQYKMIETMYLAFLLNVNPFDQPGVERYKENVRGILGGSGE